MAMIVRTSKGSDDPCHHLWLHTRCSQSQGLDESGGLPVALGSIVSNDLLSVRALTPGTRFSMRLSTRAGSPVGGDPI